MKAWSKDDNAKLDWTFTWTSWLAVGETIDTYTIAVDGDTTPAPPGLTIDSDSNTPTTVTAWLAGGEVGHNYKVTCQVTTTLGRIDARTIQINVEQR